MGREKGLIRSQRDGARHGTYGVLFIGKVVGIKKMMRIGIVVDQMGWRGLFLSLGKSQEVLLIERCLEAIAV